MYEKLYEVMTLKNGKTLITFPKTHKPKFFMMIGLPASGKSTFANEIKKFYDENCIEGKFSIHSTDKLREEMLGDVNDQSKNLDIFTEIKKRIKNDLKLGKDVLLDATNVNKKKRIDFLNNLNGVECFKICINMLTPYSECLYNNSQRERKVPEDVIKRMYMGWCPPSNDEGFDYIWGRYNYGRMSKNDFRIDDFLFKKINAVDMQHENSHHSATIGNHCILAGQYIQKKYPNAPKHVKIAALIHDCGKPFCKTYIDNKGNVGEEAHYYNHNNCGAYDSMFYTDYLGMSGFERSEIAHLVYYHMKPIMEKWVCDATDESKMVKSQAKFKKAYANIPEFYNNLMMLHEADMMAH